MSDNPEKAASCFKEGFSCSQAVFSTFSGDLGLDRITALKISQPFGGGIARMGEICGAVSGAFLAIGLKHGRTKAEDLEARDKTYAIMREFMARFKDRHGSLRCKELLGYDLNTDIGMHLAHESGLLDTLCPNLVRSAAEILENLL